MSEVAIDGLLNREQPLMRKDYMVALNSTAEQLMAGSCDLLSQFLGWCLESLAQQLEVKVAGIDEVRQAKDSSNPHAPARARFSPRQTPQGVSP